MGSLRVTAQSAWFLSLLYGTACLGFFFFFLILIFFTIGMQTFEHITACPLNCEIGKIMNICVIAQNYL